MNEIAKPRKSETIDAVKRLTKAEMEEPLQLEGDSAEKVVDEVCEYTQQLLAGLQ